MSAKFNKDEHLAEILDAAIRLAPVCTSGVDFSNTGGEGRYSHSGKSDMQIVADRAWLMGEAMIEKYHAEVEAAGVRAAEDEKLAQRQAKAPKREATHG